MHGESRRILPIVLLAALLVAGWSYAGSYLSIVQVWDTNSSFSHGFLIPPICLWLTWRKRRELATIDLRPSWLGAFAVLGFVALWVVARGAGVVGPEQFAVVALIPALVLAVLGWGAARVLGFPLCYLIFAVPVGHVLVPMLMQATADVATWALQLTGVPVYRSHMYISIPSGKFEVARACSGLNYVVTGLALGMLYSYLTYEGWRKRLTSMAAFVLIPIFANGLRVYLTILVAHLTNMKYGPGPEHVLFGKVFFIFVMLSMFWVGRRWHDDPQPAPAAGLIAPARRWSASTWAVAAAVCAALAAGPAYVAWATDRVERRLAEEAARLQLPEAAAGWTGPVTDGKGWRPLYSGARVERAGSYAVDGAPPVDVFVGVYGVGTTGGAEMISFGNRIFAEERKVLSNERSRDVPLSSGGQMTVREQAVQDASGSHLVWYWYMVGQRHLTDPYRVKAQEALAFLTRDAVTERVVTLSTPSDGSEVERLQRFVASHESCVASGFAFEACSP